MQYEGKIYRPWPEWRSLLIQTSVGCTHNKCTFCDMFREKRFRIRKLEDVLRDIDEAGKLAPQTESIFLVDGNVLALRTSYLLQVLERITSTFPKCSKISLYSGLNDLRRKSVEELSELKQAGLSMAYVGLESGDPQTLQQIKKGLTPEQAEEGMAHAKAAGIEVLISIILGIGGKHRSTEHIVETTRLLNVMQPEELAPMALTVQPGTELQQQVESGEFIVPSPLQILEEEKYLLENLAGFDTFYWGDHGNNILSLKGKLPQSRQWFLKRIEQAMAEHPVTRQKVLQTHAW